MPTRSIGAGTCNFPVNMATEERSVWGRIAFSHGRSIGAEIRRLALIGLKAESPESADRIERIRRARRQLVAGALCGVALFVSVVQSFAGQGLPMRKTSARVKVRENEVEVA